MGITGLSNSQYISSLTASSKVEATKQVQRGTKFSELMNADTNKCPYNYLAKNGIIEYRGAVFVCDYDTNSICLGDMSNPKNVLNIPLSSGGSLRVNVNNIGDLQNAIGMFSPADVNAIMRAIAQYNHCTSKLNEIDETKEQVIETTSDCAVDEAKENDD